MPVYPSFYPHEIEITAVAPRSRGRLLLAGKIQAYVGNAPRFAAAPPDTIDSVESLGSFVIVRVNPASPRARDEQSACATAEAVVRDLAGKGGGLVVHPYPVTPFHGDYLHHVDRAEAAKARVLRRAASWVRCPAQGQGGRRIWRSASCAPRWLRAGPGLGCRRSRRLSAADLIARASRRDQRLAGPAWLEPDGSRPIFFWATAPAMQT